MDASRVTFVPSVGRHLFHAITSALLVPVLVTAAPTLLIASLVWAVADVAAAWNTVLVLAAVMLTVGVVLAGVMAYDQLGEPRWIECRPAGVAERLVVKKIVGTQPVPVSDVRLVEVVETVTLGRSTGCAVTVSVADGPSIECPRIMGERLVVPAAELGAWFRHRLGPTGVEVVHQTVIERSRIPQSWYPAGQVAAIWGVPVSEVATTAKRLAVHSSTSTPTVRGHYRPDLTTTLFDPDDVHAVTAQVRSGAIRRR